MRRYRIMRAILAAAIVFWGGMLFMPAKAGAMCVYNKDTTWYDVDFDCGLVCSNSWTIDSKTDKCRGGKGGTVTVYWGNLPGETCKVKVDKHGWVTITSKNYGEDWATVVTSRHSDGSVRQRCQGSISSPSPKKPSSK